MFVSVNAYISDTVIGRALKLSGHIVYHRSQKKSIFEFGHTKNRKNKQITILNFETCAFIPFVLLLFSYTFALRESRSVGFTSVDAGKTIYMFRGVIMISAGV